MIDISYYIKGINICLNLKVLCLCKVCLLGVNKWYLRFCIVFWLMWVNVFREKEFFMLYVFFGTNCMGRGNFFFINNLKKTFKYLNIFFKYVVSYFMMFIKRWYLIKKMVCWWSDIRVKEGVVCIWGWNVYYIFCFFFKVG